MGFFRKLFGGEEPLDLTKPMSPEVRARHIEMIRDVSMWPHQVVLPMIREETGQFGFLLADDPGVLYFGFIAAIPNDVLEALRGNASGAVLEAWKRNQTAIRFVDAPDMLDAGWCVD